MRYQIELGPRMPSTRTSAGSSFRPPPDTCPAMLSSAAIASSLVLVRAISISGIVETRRLVRPDLRAPFGAFSAGPSRSARSSSGSRPACGVVHSLPRVAESVEAVRHGGDRELLGPAVGTSSQNSGVDTRASGVARTE